MFVLAQLIEPPIQPGPVRLPNRPSQERQRQEEASPPPVLLPVPAPSPEQPQESLDPSAQPGTWRPSLKGKTPYSEAELQKIFSSCGSASVAKTLNACAAALTARLVKDGYVNSRVYVSATPAPGALDVVLGVIAELRISSDDDALKTSVEQQLDPLIGTVLHLPTLEAALVKVRRSGVGSIQGSMGRLGSDPTKAVINLAVEPAPPSPLQGDLSLSNTGNAGSGEWRAMASLLQNNLMRQGDTGLLFIELDADGELELGTGVISGTYTWPLSDSWTLTGSFGYSYRRFVEFEKPFYNFSFRTLQGLLQLETLLKQEPTFRWTAFAGVSANRTDSFESGGKPDIPLVAGGANVLRLADGDWDSWSRSGYLKIGTNLSGTAGNAFWNANLYAMQGLAVLSPDQHLFNMAAMGVEPGEARAVGAVADLSWGLSPSTTLNLRGAGQAALNPLPGSMTFVLGSDVGLRGLPGTVISGESGLLGTGELVWTAWTQGDQSLQLVPFIGMGGVWNDSGRIKNTLGSGGLMGRYRHGGFELELGWVDAFNSDDDSEDWNQWILGNGLYTKVRYSF